MPLSPKLVGAAKTAGKAALGLGAAGFGPALIGTIVASLGLSVALPLLRRYAAGEVTAEELQAEVARVQSSRSQTVGSILANEESVRGKQAFVESQRMAPLGQAASTLSDPYFAGDLLNASAASPPVDIPPDPAYNIVHAVTGTSPTNPG